MGLKMSSGTLGEWKQRNKNKHVPDTSRSGGIDVGRNKGNGSGLSPFINTVLMKGCWPETLTLFFFPWALPGLQCVSSIFSFFITFWQRVGRRFQVQMSWGKFGGSRVMSVEVFHIVISVSPGIHHDATSLSKLNGLSLLCCIWDVAVERLAIAMAYIATGTALEKHPRKCAKMFLRDKVWYS